MERRRHQTVRFGEETIEMETVNIRGIECLRLEDVKLRFPSVTTLRINNVQLAFVSDEHGKNLEPLHVKACTDQVIEGIAPSTLSRINSQDQLNTISEQIAKLQKTTERIDANTQEMLHRMQALMTEMYELHEYSTPRYFFIIPARNQDWPAIRSVKERFQLHYKLHFLCECSDDPTKLHIAPHEGYSIKKPGDFIARYGPYLRTTQSAVKTLLTIASVALPALEKMSTIVTKNTTLYLQSSVRFDNMREKVEFTEILLDQASINSLSVDTSTHGKAPKIKAPLQGTDLRELESYLQLVDSRKSLGNLYRIVTTDGHVRWVCLEHYDEISFINKTVEHIRQWETIGGQFNEEKTTATIDQVYLIEKNITILRQSLSNGFNISKLVLKKCSLYEGYLDMLLDTIINRSSIHYLEMIALNVCNWFSVSKYICEYVIIYLTNQSLKVRCHDQYQYGNSQVLIRILLQNRIYQKFDFSACDFFKQEQALSYCLDGNTMITTLVANYSNNVEILNAISNLKTTKTQLFSHFPIHIISFL